MVNSTVTGLGTDQPSDQRNDDRRVVHPRHGQAETGRRKGPGCGEGALGNTGKEVG